MYLRCLYTLCISLFVLQGCGGNSSSSSDNNSIDDLIDTPVTLSFAARSNHLDINCNDVYTGFGPDEEAFIGIGDLRFFVSNIRAYNASDDLVAVTWDNNEFQYNHESGSVALIDFLGAGSNFCETVAEATGRTNTVITGISNGEVISKVTFDIGVPQALMKAVIAAGPVEDAPSPLNELNWSWAGGYRHFVINFTMMNSSNSAIINNSSIHIGSTDCGGDFSAGINALTDRDECGYLNTAQVSLEQFNPESNIIVFDVASALSNIRATDLVSDVWQAHNGDETLCIDERRDGEWCVTGQNFGLQCHSGLATEACQSIFPNFGIELTTGESSSQTNSVFYAE
ncbi:MbnP family copper-binding protein [Aliikangiella maris]|uniref:MbnP family copper-binding protein n=2 Tax=Aliikangiella maris TaxID=3162458 RepID=A0ABV3MN34_9GAMM